MTDIYVETCTIHDDIHLTHHDIHISGSDSSSSSSLSSLGESGLLGRSHQRAGGFPLSIKNDNRFIIWSINRALILILLVNQRLEYNVILGE